MEKQKATTPQHFGKVEFTRTVDIEVEGPFETIEQAKRWANNRRRQLLNQTNADPGYVHAYAYTEA